MATANSLAVLRRSLLYVPASSQKMLSKSLSLKSDNITYDLEDSVTPSLKPIARNNLKSHLLSHTTPPSPNNSNKGAPELAVRINAISTPFALDDIYLLASTPSLDAIVVPKVQSPSDLTFVTDVLRHISPDRHRPDSPNPIRIIALIESARAVMDLSSICKASPYLNGLIFAAEDFALDLSITRTPSLSEFLYARSAIVTAARAYDIPSVIDLVCTSFRGEEGMRTLQGECRNGKNIGFNGKQCIHPSQVDVVQRLFAPSQNEVEWAMRISIADDKAASTGRGAWTLDGKMIDAPVVGKAFSILAKAEQCGFNIQEIRDKWQHQEPE